MRRPSERGAPPSGESPNEHVARNVEEIARIEEVEGGLSDGLARGVTRLSGSMPYVWLHVVWFTLWVAINTGLLGIEPFDEFPFSLLTMIVSLEAIFLSVFVLMSENRQSAVADRRAKVDLQINLLSEQEITKLMQLVSEIHDQLLPHHEHDPDAEEMKKATRVEEIAQAIDETDGSSK